MTSRAFAAVALVAWVAIAIAFAAACTRTVVLAPPVPPDAGSFFPDGFIEDAGSGNGSGGGSGGSSVPADGGTDGGIAPDGP